MSGDRTEYFELLFSRASAPGTNFRRIAGEASKRVPASSPKRKKFMEELYGEHIKETAKGKGSRVARKGDSGAGELGVALQGLHGVPAVAAMYSFAMDWSARGPLFRALRERTAEIAKREEWPECIRGTKGSWNHYQDDLTALVLDMDWLKAMTQLWDEDHPKDARSYVSMEATLLNVSEEIWHTKLRPYYRSILEVFEGWQGRARGYIERGIAGEMRRIDPADRKRREIA